MRLFERKVRSRLEAAGITVNGDKPYDIQVHNKDFYRRILIERDVGIAESYINGFFDCEKLDELIYRLLIYFGAKKHFRWVRIAKGLINYAINFQSLGRAFSAGKAHYEAGNDLFRAMLDENMIYSCGYWHGASSLAEAQRKKLDLIARKLQLEKGMRVLDVGCGWGGAARYFAAKYGVKVTGITVAENQYEWARKWCKDRDVSILLQDYRRHKGSYDAIYSIGMFEHVGSKNYSAFMAVMEDNLIAGGVFLLHTIGTPLYSDYGGASFSMVGAQYFH